MAQSFPRMTKGASLDVEKTSMSDLCIYCGSQEFISSDLTGPSPGQPGYGWSEPSVAWVCVQCGRESGAAVARRPPRFLVVGPEGPVCPDCSAAMPLPARSAGLEEEFVSCPSCAFSIHRAQLRPSPELAAGRLTRQACPRCSHLLRQSFPEFFEGTHPICDGCGYPARAVKMTPARAAALPPAPPQAAMIPPASPPRKSIFKLARPLRVRLRPPGRRDRGANAPERVQRSWRQNRVFARLWEGGLRGERFYALALPARFRDADSMQARVHDDVLIRSWLMAGFRVRLAEPAPGPFELEDALGILRPEGPRPSAYEIPGQADNARWLFCGGSLEHLDRWWKLQEDFMRRKRVTPGTLLPSNALEDLVAQVTAALEHYQLDLAVASLEQGLSGDLKAAELLELARLHAPFVPHMAEALYRNLVPLLPSSAPPSVHLAGWPGGETVWF